MSLRKRLMSFFRSPWFRWIVLAMALFAAIWAVAKNWTEVRDALLSLPLWIDALQVILGFVYVYMTMVSWRFVLNDVGPSIPPKVARRIFFSSQIAKYLPGGVWNFVAAAEIGRDYSISRRRSISALVVSIVISIVTGLVLALIAAALSPSQGSSDLLWFGVAIPIGIVILMPPVLNRVVNLALRLTKREPLEDQMSWFGTLWAVFWALMSWLVIGLQLWLMLINLGMAASLSTYLLSVGGYALGWIAGFLVFFVPAGVGVREVTLGVILSTVVNSGSVVVVVLLIRVFTTIADVGLGVLASIAIRKKKATEIEENHNGDEPLLH